MSHRTQAEIILERLQMAHGDWVPMPELAAVSGAFAVHSRIADLRKQGWPIPAPRITVRNGVKCSEYRLICDRTLRLDEHPGNS